MLVPPSNWCSSGVVTDSQTCLGMIGTSARATRSKPGLGASRTKVAFRSSVTRTSTSPRRSRANRLAAAFVT